MAQGRLYSFMLAVSISVVGTLGPGERTQGQDQSIATPGDVIFARKILMDSIGKNMDDLESMIASNKIDLVEGREHADIVSVMLMSFPHLFPVATNQWKPNGKRDPGADTFAAPEVWSNFEDFYKRSGAASRKAFDASRAENPEEFRRFVTELRVACDSCHQTYMKIDR